jgi:lipopolysaccharide/colanic/teichoic acid biosynthesis glycosyltransferase
LIKIDDNGKIFHISKRIGKDSKVFNMYKLRTMKENSKDIRNSDGSTYNAIDDNRLTKIGKLLRKTSIDELPQIINVIKGDMSLVGPRPDLEDQLLLYDEYSLNKLKMKPGVTGYAMAYYRNSITWTEKIQYDVYYIQNVSFFLDIKILFKTFINVILRKNIFIDKNNVIDDEKK